jgi:hypothetical protein
MDDFLAKLREQSFTIILLVGIMYYQNQIFTNQMEEYKKMIHDKETLVLKIIDDERSRLLEREKYLMTQRDEFIQLLKDGYMQPKTDVKVEETNEKPN